MTKTNVFWLLIQGMVLLLATLCLLWLAGCQPQPEALEPVVFDAVTTAPEQPKAGAPQVKPTQTDRPDTAADSQPLANGSARRAPPTFVVNEMARAEEALEWEKRDGKLRSLADRLTKLEHYTYSSESPEPPPGLLPKPKPVVRQLVCFTASWCQPCRAMHAVWDALKAEKLHVEIVDIDHPPKWAEGYEPKQIPLTVLCVNGQRIAHWIGTVPEQTLRDALQSKGVIDPSLGKIIECPIDAKLTAFAQQSADLQAKANRQGHLDWANRRAKIIEATGYQSVEEICAQSWDREKDATEDALWKSAFDSWKQSSGHWSIANKYHAGYGAAMAKASNNIWFAAILAGDRQRQSDYKTKEDCSSGSRPRK